METSQSQKSIRVMHYIGEFLDLDAKSFSSIAEFIALIQAIREGLGHIDSGFVVSDSHINLLFLSKLQAHPEWNEWARYMLRDHRINVSEDYSAESGMPFYELAELAIQREKEARAQVTARKKQEQDGVNSRQQESTSSSSDKHNKRFQTFTQEEINSFVVRQMRMDQQASTTPPTETTAQKSKGHSKRPSQEEINEFVIRQMRKEQQRKTRARSRSEPKPNKPITTTTTTTTKTTPNHIDTTASTTSSVTMLNVDNDARCDKCGDKTHTGLKCHPSTYTTTKPIAVVPRANFTPKKVEFRKQAPGGFPMYHTSFALT